MDVSDLASKFPNLWHITFGGGWEGIEPSGLLRAIDIDPDSCSELRDEITSVEGPGGTKVTLRNQLHSRVDPTPYLDGITPAEWWQLINSRVYFFCREVDADAFLQTYLGQGHVQEVVKVRTKPVLDAVADNVQVTTVNAGVFPRTKGPSRGPATFIALAGYPMAKASSIKEITVSVPVPVPLSVVTTVMRYEVDGERSLLHR